MTHQVTWGEHAIGQAARFLKDDPDGLRLLVDADGLLGDHPRPEGSAAHGAPTPRRVHGGRYRAMYEITDAAVTVIVIPAGRTGRPPTAPATAAPPGSPAGRAGLSPRSEGPGPFVRPRPSRQTRAGVRP
ncbi:MAG TPA: hypothetical protein VN520_22015 [Streptomyces sp.]|uniref:type II toxin-antitoxin system RelE family toxin n=1 Tax=Streptomyces sp. TaxID=1931 RepID=UPI002C3CC32B|nr:hypothetical protein [Streptomyces sp.]HWU09023.1 hypothetical protein [Streptomyces sp.]